VTLRSAIHRATAGLFLGAVGLASAGACGARSELPVPDPCAGSTALAGKVAPLDLVVMMDNSGSMEISTPSGEPRRQAVLDAFSRFLQQPEAAGLGVSLSFFPIIDESVPEACNDDATCGMAGACQPYRACLPSGGGSCRADQDCADAGFPGDTCEQLGFCDDLITGCIVGTESCAGGVCLDLNRCDNRYTCDASGYETPLVPMVSLPEGAAEFLGQLQMLEPLGSTPTLPALLGAIRQARTWADAHPEHNTIVVLATDGLPTACDPELQSGDPELAIVHLAEAARDSYEDGIPVYVIGLATPVEGGARTDLDSIAEAGGSEHAFIVDAEIAVALGGALTAIRLGAGACEFDVEVDPADLGEPRRSRLRLLLADSQPYVPWREGPAACGSGQGFYYDDPPAAGTTRVVLCPASCSRLGNSLARNVELFTDCPLL
jgi:hypothetical protein